MTKKTPAPAAVADFERSLDELETLVKTMERGEMTLDESLQSYERGVALVRSCQSALEQAEQRVKLLTDPLNPAGGVPFEPAT